MLISPVNDNPTAAAYRLLETVEDGEVTIKVADLLADSFDVEDGTNLRFGGIEDSINGDAYVDRDGILHFLPTHDFAGAAFLSYKILDSEGGSGIGYIGINVFGENDPPVALDDEGITAWSNNRYENVFPAYVFLKNDIDPDGDTLTIVSAVGAEYGTVSVDGLGNLHYIAPSDDWVGIDSFTYRITDGNGNESEATATIDVRINTSPDVYPEKIFTKEDVISFLTPAQLLGNDSDIDGDTLKIIGVDMAEHCKVSLLADGTVLFVPEANYNNNYPGQASFRYTVSDGVSDSVSTFAFFDITPVNDAPILTGEVVSGAFEDNDFTFNAAFLMANDTDVEMVSPYEEDSISFAGLVGGVAHGSISYNSTTGMIFYRPNADFFGTETFSYKVVDSYGASSVVESQIYVENVPDRPLVQYDRATGPAEDSVWNKYAISELVGNDYDADGDTLTITSASASNAEVKISGGYLWVKPDFQTSHVTVNYKVTDGLFEVASKLDISEIIEHNFAPVFTGLYNTEIESGGWFSGSDALWFAFQTTDKNGGDTFSGDWGDIASVTISSVKGGKVTTNTTMTGGKFEGDFASGSLVMTAIDMQGASSSIFIDIAKLKYNVVWAHYTPVVLDLDGDGIELLNRSAGVTFDWLGNGEGQETGWAGSDDGFLVYDYNHDRMVTEADELSLRDYKEGAVTDLEGLQAFDTNEDGSLTGDDVEWNSFGVWRDANSNGVTDDGEFFSLDELNITSVNLQSDDDFHMENGNVVYGSATYETSDGTTHEVGDVGLNGEEINLQQTDTFALGEIEEDTLVLDADASEDDESDLLADTTAEEALLDSEEEVHSLADDATDPVDEVDSELNNEMVADVQLDDAASGHGLVNTAPDGNSLADTGLSFDEAEISRITLEINSDLASAGALDDTASAGAETAIPDVYVDIDDNTQDHTDDADPFVIC